MSLPPSFKKIIFFSVFISSLFFSGIFAQETLKITVSPFILEERVKPGEEFEREIFITNETEEKLVLEIKIQDIRLDEKGNLQILSPETQRFSLKDWMEIKEKEIEILPKSTQKIKALFKIPQKEVAGSRHGAILFSPKNFFQENQREGIFARVFPEVGVLVFLSSSEKVKEELRIFRFESEKKYYLSPFFGKFLIELENSGNVYLVPSGKIVIENWQGKKIKEIPFNTQKLKILPESKRIFEEFFEIKFGMGKYKATFFCVFGTPQSEGGEGTKTIFRTTSFWIIPKREIFWASFLILFFLFFLAKKLKKKSN